MMMNEFESENIGEENATVKNPVTEIKPAIDADNVLNQVEKLKIIDQHNSDSVQQKNILKKKIEVDYFGNLPQNIKKHI